MNLNNRIFRRLIGPAAEKKLLPATVAAGA
jgi:hypothetical protein